MTKDELIALRRERGKQELNIGDRVKVYDRDGSLMYDGKTAIIIEKALLDPTEFYYGLYVEGETVDKYRGKGLLYLKNTATKIGKTALLAPFFAEDLELVKKPTHFVGEQPLTVERARKEMEGIASEIANNPEKAEQIQKEWEEAVSAKEQPTDEIKVGDRVKFKSEEEIKKMLEPSFWWGISIFADKEATIIGIDEPYGYRIDIDPSLGGIRREFFDKLPKNQPDNTITIPVKADFGEDVGFALLDRALELQKKYTELEGEVKRLYDVILARQIERFTIYSPFDNQYLGLIAGTLNNFRPLTAEERLQQEAELKEFIDKTLKKQSE